MFQYTRLTEEEWEAYLELCPAPLHWSVLPAGDCSVSFYHCPVDAPKVWVAEMTITEGVREYRLVRSYKPVEHMDDPFEHMRPEERTDPPMLVRRGNYTNKRENRELPYFEV